MQKVGHLASLLMFFKKEYQILFPVLHPSPLSNHHHKKDSFFLKDQSYFPTKEIAGIHWEKSVNFMQQDIRTNVFIAAFTWARFEALYRNRQVELRYTLLRHRFHYIQIKRNQQYPLLLTFWETLQTSWMVT